MTMEEPAETCYAELMEHLSDGERETVAESAAVLATTADRLAQVRLDAGEDGAAAEFRRLADYQARLEELALATEPAPEPEADTDIDP